MVDQKAKLLSYLSWSVCSFYLSKRLLWWTIPANVSINMGGLFIGWAFLGSWTWLFFPLSQVICVRFQGIIFNLLESNNSYIQISPTIVIDKLILFKNRQQTIDILEYFWVEKFQENQSSSICYARHISVSFRCA